MSLLFSEFFKEQVTFTVKEIVTSNNIPLSAAEVKEKTCRSAVFAVPCPPLYRFARNFLMEGDSPGEDSPLLLVPVIDFSAPVC